MSKKYTATVVIRKELSKEIEIPDNLDEDMIESYIDDNFVETHYKNFDDSWGNNLMLDEDYEIIDYEEVKKWVK